MSRRRVPRPAAVAIREAAQAAQPATLLARVQGVWAEAVGEAISAQASPVAERDGTITVTCRSATWAHELDLLGDRIVSRLRAQLPSEAGLSGLRFRVGANLP
jgi:predicted nucleic acid-binding Zn ribbon protein